MIIEGLQEADYLRESQYKDSTYLTARAQLHKRFSTAVVDWQTWVFDHLHLQEGETILECGCGPGWLWRSSLQRIPAGCHITLTDLSSGMITETQAALAHAPRQFHFQTADIQELPFPDVSFDVVVANHMLYHVPDIPKALAEVRRVLRPHGRFHAVTNGVEHMRELNELVADALQYVGVDVRALSRQALPFRLENGAALLAPFFSQVQLFRHEDSLHVTEVQPLVDYALSSQEAQALLTIDRLARIRQFIADRMTASGGALHITKAVGMFVGVKAA